MKVVSWNLGINTVGHARHERGWHYLAALDPDLALLQEVRPPTWAQHHWGIVAGSFANWGSAIVYRRGLDVRAIETQRPSRLETDGYLVQAELRTPDGLSLLVGSVHPAAEYATPEDLGDRDPRTLLRGRNRKVRKNDVAYAIFRDCSVGRRFIVGGDWNISPEIWDGVHPGATESAFFDRARSDGWIDAREHLGLDELPTWRQPPFPSYQLDHVFVDRQTADSLRSLEVNSHPALDLGVSDHAPVVVELDLPL